MTRPIRVTLGIEDLPRSYVNIVPYLREPLPPAVDPVTSEPVTVERLSAVFPTECARQELCTDPEIPIPEELRESYIQIGRPTPLQRAVHLEQKLRTPARIYFKREDLSPTGSHKLNTALAQAYFALKDGAQRLTAETGAGQWGCAVALAASHFGLSASIYMVRTSFEQKPYRTFMMRMYGAEVIQSPSELTESGKRVRANSPEHPGSIGIAISEAVEDTLHSPGTKYANGSVMNHVLLHQTVIGQEVVQQLRKVDETPDAVVGCVGGGSNFAGISYPMMVRPEYRDVSFIAVEPDACNKMTRGEYRYDFIDSAGLLPRLKMHTLGADFTPRRIHAGGLRYHGVSPTVSVLINERRVHPVAYDQVAVLEAGRLFAQTEGIVPAPESSHAIRAAIDLATAARRDDREMVIVFNLSGHGHFDMGAYGMLMDGALAMPPLAA